MNPGLSGLRVTLFSLYFAPQSIRKGKWCVRAMRKDSPALSWQLPRQFRNSLQTFVLCSLCYQGPFITTLAFRTLPSAKVTFHLSFSLWYTDPQNCSVIVCIAKRASQGRSLALKWNVNLIFFLSLGFLTFKNIFPSNPMVVVSACLRILCHKYTP